MFKPDASNLIQAVKNQRPARLPLYEHIISPVIMEEVLGKQFKDGINGTHSDVADFFRNYCHFFEEMTYDTVSFEVCVTEILPGHGAILGGKAGPIQNRKDFECYPWDMLAEAFFKCADPKFAALSAALPEGMRAVGGVGNGVFEISADLVGLEYLAYMQIDDPQLFADVYNKIGLLLVNIWKRFLAKYGEDFAVCRFGDDLGFRSGTLTGPDVIRTHIIPQYARIINVIKSYDKPFLWHSCGCIFEIMDDVINLGIDAKHSNEDAIAYFDEWIERYSSRIGLMGGIDVDHLCTKAPSEIAEFAYKQGRRFRKMAKGYALGSGNSIPDYIPVENYLAMVGAAKRIRNEELV